MRCAIIWPPHTAKGGETVEKNLEKKELSLAELKEQRTELLPDRLEMHRRRWGFRNTAFSGAFFGDNFVVVVVD